MSTGEYEQEIDSAQTNTNYSKAESVIAYNVRLKRKDVMTNVVPKMYVSDGKKARYSLSGIGSDGTKMNKFCSKAVAESYGTPVAVQSKSSGRKSSGRRKKAKEGYVINPESGRQVKMGGAVYRRLVKSGKLSTGSEIQGKKSQSKKKAQASKSSGRRGKTISPKKVSSSSFERTTHYSIDDDAQGGNFSDETESRLHDLDMTENTSARKRGVPHVGKQRQEDPGVFGGDILVSKPLSLSDFAPTSKTNTKSALSKQSGRRTNVSLSTNTSQLKTSQLKSNSLANINTSKYVINPQSGRKVAVGGNTYKRLVRDGILTGNETTTSSVKNSGRKSSGRKSSGRRAPLKEGYTINPSSGRQIKIGGPTYKKLVRNNIISE